MGQQEPILLEKAFMGILGIAWGTSVLSRASLGNGRDSGHLVFTDSCVVKRHSQDFIKNNGKDGCAQVIFLSLHLRLLKFYVLSNCH